MSQSVYRSRRHRPWYRKITRAQVGLVGGGFAILVLLLFLFQASRASTSLRLAANQAQVLQNQIVAGDDDAARETLQGLRSSAERARTSTDGLLWDLGSKVPFLGKNVSAMQGVSIAIDTIAQSALPPIVNLSKQINLNTFSPKDGKVDIAAIERIEPAVESAFEALVDANDEIRDIDSGSLLVPLRAPVSEIQLKVANAEAASRSASVAARLLPSMLGKNEKRKYLLLIQNNAEIRSTGGIVGSFAILKANKGKLSMGKQGSASDLRGYDRAVVPLTDDERSVFTTALMTDVRNANLTPDFPRTGQITRAMVKKSLSEDVDGVISVDPVAMSYVLGGTGPIELQEGVQLSQQNAVSVLLNSVYTKVLDAGKQDEIFETVARKVFDAVKSGRGDSRLAITGLVQAARENRLLVWSSHKREQRLLAPSGLAGALSKDDGATPHVGLYLSDAAGGKMEYYLDFRTRVTTRHCLDGNVQEIMTSTQVTSNAPSNAAKLSPFVTGTGALTPRGTMRLNLRFYSPYAGGFTDLRVNDKRQTVYADKHFGRNVTRAVLQLEPGESVVVTTSMISGPNQPGDIIFSTTPGIVSAPNDLVIPSACG